MFYRIHVLHKSEWHAARMTDINHIERTVTFQSPGQPDQTEPFRRVQNIALCEDTGEVVQNFGGPSAHWPATTQPTQPDTHRHQDAPLIAYPMYFERQYCNDCRAYHMVEVTRHRDLICHGINYYQDAQRNRTHYARHLGHGSELVPYDRQPLALDWQMALDAARETIDQDW